MGRRFPAMVLAALSPLIVTSAGCGGSTERTASTRAGSASSSQTSGAVSSGGQGGTSTGGASTVSTDTGGSASGGVATTNSGAGGAIEIGGAAGEAGGAGASSGDAGGETQETFTCCSSCDYESECSAGLHTNYTLEYAGAFAEAEGEPLSAIAPGDRVVLAVEVKDKADSGYVEVGLKPSDADTSVSVEPIGPVLFSPECSSIPFGAAGDNFFEVEFGSDLPDGATINFTSWGSMRSEDRECTGPSIEFALTLD